MEVYPETIHEMQETETWHMLQRQKHTNTDVYQTSKNNFKCHDHDLITNSKKSQ